MWRPGAGEAAVPMTVRDMMHLLYFEPDNVDGFANGSGFPLTSSDQLAYNRFLATEAHARGSFATESWSGMARLARFAASKRTPKRSRPAWSAALGFRASTMSKSTTSSSATKRSR